MSLFFTYQFLQLSELLDGLVDHIADGETTISAGDQHLGLSELNVDANASPRHVVQ